MSRDLVREISIGYMVEGGDRTETPRASVKYFLGGWSGRAARHDSSIAGIDSYISN